MGEAPPGPTLTGSQTWGEALLSHPSFFTGGFPPSSVLRSRRDLGEEAGEGQGSTWPWSPLCNRVTARLYLAPNVHDSESLHFQVGLLFSNFQTQGCQKLLELTHFSMKGTWPQGGNRCGAGCWLTVRLKQCKAGVHCLVPDIKS